MRREKKGTFLADVELAYYMDMTHNKSSGFAPKNYKIRVYERLPVEFLNPS